MAGLEQYQTKPNKLTEKVTTPLSQTARFNRDVRVDQLSDQIAALRMTTEQQSRKIRQLESQLEQVTAVLRRG